MLIRTTSEVQRDQQMMIQIRSSISGAKRIVFLGFGFQPQNVDLLVDYGLSHDPEFAITVHGMSRSNRESLIRMMKRKFGVEHDELLLVLDAKCNDLMRDFSLLLES